MIKRKSRKKFLSIMLIPDDYSDPFSFKVSFKLVKVLTVLAFFLMIHIFVGAVYYYKFSVTNHYREQLEHENISLRDDNRQVYAMYDQVQELLQFQARFREILGVDKGFEISDRKTAKIFETLRQNKNIVSSNVSNPPLYRTDVSFDNSKLDFSLTRSTSNYHSFASNIPTYLPVEGFLSTDFRKDDWLLPDHLGIDIATNRGSNVRAAGDGVVIFANWTEDLGNLIIIYHFNEFLTFYGHNQVLLKRESTFVKKGETIAMLGSTGRSTAPHLHFEVWKNG